MTYKHTGLGTLLVKTGVVHLAVVVHVSNITQGVISGICDIREIEMTVKNGIDVFIKHVGIITIHEECFLIIFMVRYNDGLYEFLPFHDLRWRR